MRKREEVIADEAQGACEELGGSRGRGVLRGSEGSDYKDFQKNDTNLDFYPGL